MFKDKCKLKNEILFLKNKILDICSDISLAYAKTKCLKHVFCKIRFGILGEYTFHILSFTHTHFANHIIIARKLFRSASSLHPCALCFASL